MRANRIEEDKKWRPEDIKRLRASLNLTQHQMGEQLGVEQQRISDWEQRAPGKSYQKIITMVFGEPR